MQKRTKTAQFFWAVTLTTSALWPQTQAALVTTVDLGSAINFAILAGAGITVAAPPGTVINGDIGSSPTPSITGLENATLNGVNHGANAVTQTAKTDLQAAYTDAATRPANFPFADGAILTGTLIGGVYQSAGSFTINSSITLDGGGNPNMVWIFQTASTLEATSASSFILTNGALASNVFWQVGSSATLNTGAQFTGTILASESITMNAGVNVLGRALANNGAVSMGSTVVAIPEPSAHALLAFSSVCCLILRRRRGRN